MNTDGHLKAYNTDYTAIEQLLKTNAVPTDYSVLVQGAGGMAKATVAALRDGGFTDVTVLARNETTGRALAEQHDVGITNDIAAQRRHQVREPAIAQILAPVTQIVWLEHAVVIDAILDAATDVVAINCEHRLDVTFGRRPHDHCVGVARRFRLRQVLLPLVVLHRSEYPRHSATT